MWDEFKRRLQRRERARRVASRRLSHSRESESGSKVSLSVPDTQDVPSGPPNQQPTKKSGGDREKPTSDAAAADSQASAHTRPLARAHADTHAISNADVIDIAADDADVALDANAGGAVLDANADAVVDDIKPDIVEPGVSRVCRRSRSRSRSRSRALALSLAFSRSCVHTLAFTLTLSWSTTTALSFPPFRAPTFV